MAQSKKEKKPNQRNVKGSKFEALTDLSTLWGALPAHIEHVAKSQTAKLMASYFDVQIKDVVGIARQSDEMFINHASHEVLVVEKKHQCVSGTADEKVLYMNNLFEDYRRAVVAAAMRHAENQDMPIPNITFMLIVNDWFNKEKYEAKIRDMRLSNVHVMIISDFSVQSSEVKSVLETFANRKIYDRVERLEKYQKYNKLMNELQSLH